MADKVIDVPGLGVVSFPDTMSDSDISRAIQGQLHPQHTAGSGKTGARLKGEPAPPKSLSPIGSMGDVMLPAMAAAGEPDATLGERAEGMGAMLMPPAMLAPLSGLGELRSPITMGPPRLVKPGLSLPARAATSLIPNHILRTAIRGAMVNPEADMAPASMLQRLQLQSPLRTIPAERPAPVWSGVSTPTPEALPDVSSIQSSLPSGRIPGQPQRKIPSRPPMWEGMPTPTPEALPDVSPIPSTLPSGRVPGQPQPKSAGRAPVWEGMPTPTRESLPDVSPIQGSLPSGRVPGQPTQGIRSTPFEPMSQTLPPIDKFEMNRMIHAKAQELELPNSPAGKSGHPQLSEAAKLNFGVKSFSELNVEQMRKLYDFLDRTGTMPMKAELRPNGK